jgi:tyrosine-protein phosphatase SIW14
MLRVLIAFSVITGFAMAADTVPGVPNFHQVDDHLYRGAQPTPEGFGNLAKLGIRTVVDLREPGDRERTEEQTVTADGMHYIHIAMNGYHAPSNDQITQLLGILSHDSGPVFIHCKRGADRTGTVVACYRIARENWPNEKALAEAKQYGMSWTELSMQDFVRHFSPAQIAISSDIKSLPPQT